MRKPVLILGAGGHSRVLVDVLKLLSVEIIGLVDADQDKKGTLVDSVPVLGGDEMVYDYSVEAIDLVNGVGSVGRPFLRQEIFERFCSAGYRFATVVHPSAVISGSVRLSEGGQVMAGAVLQPGVTIGRNVIINTGTSVDHESTIGDHAHLAPGVTVSGNVTIEAGVHVGAGATIIQGVLLGQSSLIAAGAVVIEDIAAHTVVGGVPAKVMGGREPRKK